MKLSFTLSLKLIKAGFKTIMKSICWAMLYLGAYSATVIAFSKTNSDLIIHEAEDIFNAKIYEMVSENLLLLSCIVLSTTGILLKLNGPEYGVQYMMAIAIGIITIITFLTHILIT